MMSLRPASLADGAAVEANFLKNSSDSVTGIAITSTIDFPATVAARDSGRRREPLQSGHVLKFW